MPNPDKIITIGVGGAGSRLALAFQMALLSEHGEGISTAETSFFYRTSGGASIPRLVLVDTDPVEGDEMRRAAYAVQVVHPEAIRIGSQSAARSFGRAWGGHVDTRMPQVLDSVRRLHDRSPVDGFLIFHTASGGTGGGLGAKLIEQLRVHYRNKTIMTVSLLPSIDVEGSPFDALNAALTLSRLRGRADISLLADSDRFAARVKTKRRDRMNAELCPSLVNWALLLERGQVSLAQLKSRMAADPSTPYLMVSKVQSTRGGLPKDATSELMGSAGALASYSSASFARKFSSGVLVWRGSGTPKDIAPHIQALRAWQSSRVGGTVYAHHLPGAQGKFPAAMHLFSIHGGIADLLKQRIQRPFEALVNRGMFVDALADDGVDADMLVSARTNLRATIQAYERLAT